MYKGYAEYFPREPVEKSRKPKERFEDCKLPYRMIYTSPSPKDPVWRSPKAYIPSFRT
jgi:hypothetical protein